MGTVKLLWGCLARMVLWGLGLGALLGATYGALVISLYVAIGLLVDEKAHSSPLAAVGLAFIGVPIMIPFGILGGLPVGVFFGLILGTVDGLLLGLLTRGFYLAPRDRASYLRLAGRACAVASMVAFLTIWAFLFDMDPGYVGFENTPGTIDGGPADILAFVIVPALVMGWAGRFCGRKVAQWWVRESLGEPEQRGDTASASERPETG